MCVDMTLTPVIRFSSVNLFSQIITDVDVSLLVVQYPAAQVTRFSLIHFLKLLPMSMCQCMTT